MENSGMEPAEKLDEFYADLGIRIREARLKRNIGQDEFASQLELSRASVVNIEKGRQRPMIHTLLEISRLLKTPLQNLIPGIETKEEQTTTATSWNDLLDAVSDEVVWDDATRKAVMQFLNSTKKAP